MAAPAPRSRYTQTRKCRWFARQLPSRWGNLALQSTAQPTGHADPGCQWDCIVVTQYADQDVRVRSRQRCSEVVGREDYCFQRTESGQTHSKKRFALAEIVIGTADPPVVFLGGTLPESRKPQRQQVLFPEGTPFRRSAIGTDPPAS